MLQDRHGHSINGGPHAAPGIKTPAELKAAIERGELGGNIVREGEAAAAESEVRKQVQIQAMQGVEMMLTNWAEQLEAKEKVEDNIATRHQMMQTAQAFRCTTSHIERQRKSLQGSQPETNGDAN